ncbi:MAG: hypothetical protein AB1403_00550 [Candidatus Riflebacteria bacterium]
MWRIYAFLIELVSLLYGLRLLLVCRNKKEWAGARTIFALETGSQTGAIERFRR